MPETCTDTSEQKTRISKLALASVLIGMLGLFLLPFKGILYHPRWIEFSGAGVVGLPGIIGLVFGAVALGRIIGSKRMLKGIHLAILGIILTGFITHVWLLQKTTPARQRCIRNPCIINMNRLTIAILKYGHRHGQFPDPNRWCDILLKDGQAHLENFVCPSIELQWPFRFTRPGPKMGRCHFALNTNCTLNSTPGTVLLFETKEGWNQCGGAELLTTERYDGMGCLVSDNEAAVTFVEANQLGSLKWKEEDEK
jgi:hypothetical protein